MNDPAILRILDANANRAREAIRVLEDYARFALNDERLAGELKHLRHDLAAALGGLPMEHALLARDTPGDVGTGIKAPAELVRGAARDVLTANGKRLSEALRSLEECAKTINPAVAGQIEQLRYRGYTIEQVLGRAGAAPGARFGRIRLYMLLTEALCHASAGGWERVLDSVLSAGAGGSLCVQLREKGLADAELLRRAQLVVAKCHAAGALAIINDRVDVAMLAGADGVHLGQTDMPCAAVRRLAGPELIIGVSTERIEQARQAVGDGATYIAAGPTFPTTTKEKPRIAGPAYAMQAVAEICVPVVAIGGITPENLPQLLAVGVRAVAVSAALIAQPDPGKAVGAFLRQLG